MPYEVFYAKEKLKKKKKVIQDFFFPDLRAGGTKRAGDVTVEIFEKKLTKLFTRSIPTCTIVLMSTMLGNDHRRFYVAHHDPYFSLIFAT